MKSILLTLTTFALSLTAFVLPVQSAAQTSNQEQIIQKFVIDRCRNIIAQLQQEAIYYGQQGGTGHTATAICHIENYLASVGTPFAIQMLGDLQQAGQNGFNAWRSKYGI